MEKELRDKLIALLKREVVPAIGCTEPMAVALCAAKATERLGQRPEEIEVKLSANILKNAMGVGIPGTGMVGLPIAIALGALIGKSEYGLEVLRDNTPQHTAEAKAYMNAHPISIRLKPEAPDNLYIEVHCKAEGKEGEAIIAYEHTRFIDSPNSSPNSHSSVSPSGLATPPCHPSPVREGDNTLERLTSPMAGVSSPSLTGEGWQSSEGSFDGERLGEGLGKGHDGLESMLTLRTVYNFATTAPLEEISFINEARRLNEQAAREALTGNYGHNLGKTLSRPLGRGIMGESIFSHMLSVTSAACDARMAGAMTPVMSNSGSGNQGIAATLPVCVYAHDNHNTDEELTRALTLSHLTAIYIKQSLGRLSALCGCVVASTGSSVGITYLMGGSYEQITFAVKNMIATLAGMVCDGAKPSCALKLCSGVSTAALSAMLAIQNRHVSAAEGLIEDDVDRCIHNLTRIGHDGMKETDRLVLDIMTHKGC